MADDDEDDDASDPDRTLTEEEVRQARSLAWAEEVVFDELDGPHGQSERRAVGHFLDDFLADFGPGGPNAFDPGETPHEAADEVARSLARFALAVAQRLAAGPPDDWTPAKED